LGINHPLPEITILNRDQNGNKSSSVPVHNCSRRCLRRGDVRMSRNSGIFDLFKGGTRDPVNLTNASKTAHPVLPVLPKVLFKSWILRSSHSGIPGCRIN